MPNKTYRREPRRLPAQVGRDLRQRSTSAEQLLWEQLRDRQLDGMKFRRQHRLPDTPYVVDFCCPRAKLVIEIDGSIHAGQVEQDRARQAEIEALGYRVLRFTNEQVLEGVERVVAIIALTPSPSPTST